jgi:hypothetical protein
MNFKKSLLPMAITIALSGPTFAAVEFNTKSKDELLKNPIAGIEKQSRLYYKIGGARPISTPPVDYSEINVGGDLKFGAGYSCGKFDPTLRRTLRPVLLQVCRHSFCRGTLRTFMSFCKQTHSVRKRNTNSMRRPANKWKVRLQKAKTPISSGPCLPNQQS